MMGTPVPMEQVFIDSTGDSSVGEAILGEGVLREPPTYCSSLERQLRCHKVGRVEDSGRPVLLEFIEY